MLDEYKSDMDAFVALMRDYVVGRATGEQVREFCDAFLSKRGQEVFHKEDLYDKFPWAKGEGQKGPYEMVSRSNLGGENLKVFDSFFNMLKANNGRLSEKEWNNFYWMGNDAERPAIFRRLKRGRTSPATPTRA